MYDFKCCQMVPKPQQTASEQQLDVCRQVELGGGSLAELLKRCFLFPSKKNLCRGQSVTVTLTVCKHIHRLCV